MMIVTLNIRGLGGAHWKHKRGKLKQELSKDVIDGSIDFLFLQEHHLNTQKVSSYGKLLQGNWEVYWGPGYGHEENAGGICLAARGIWRQYVVAHEILIQGQAQYVIIAKENVKWGVLNINAPNQPATRAPFWREL
jgi:hypothetical protein